MGESGSLCGWSKAVSPHSPGRQSGAGGSGPGTAGHSHTEARLPATLLCSRPRPHSQRLTKAQCGPSTHKQEAINKYGGNSSPTPRDQDQENLRENRRWVAAAYSAGHWHEGRACATLHGKRTQSNGGVGAVGLACLRLLAHGLQAPRRAWSGSLLSCPLARAGRKLNLLFLKRS